MALGPGNMSWSGRGLGGSKFGDEQMSLLDAHCFCYKKKVKNGALL